MIRLKPDQRDQTPEPRKYMEPLAVLISARAVTATKDPVWLVKREDWVCVP